ncbi:MAG: hypothetical protein Q4C95_03360 [Planctomycetia bacterium]|nr:hypothetical protein [Planctomycetia bacterium]
MAVNYQLFIDELRLLVITKVAVTEEEISSKAEEYAQLCEQANQRLKKCYFFMLKQNYSEMERLVCIEPNLFEFINALLFPELDDWRKMIRPLGLKAPEEIIIDYYLAVKDACHKYQERKPLYERLRFYSLIGAPILYRIGIMCQILNLEPKNNLLKQDIDLFDTNYFSILETEGREILQEGNLDEMQKLSQILSRRPKWAASSLAKKCAKEISKLENEKVYQELCSIGKELQDSLYDSDEMKVKECLEKWDSCIASKTDLIPPANTQIIVQKAKNWITVIAEDRKNISIYNSATEDFIQNIDSCSTKEELKNLYNEYNIKIQSLNLPVSSEIEQYVEEKLKSFTTKFVIKLLFYVSLGLVSALAVAYFISNVIK